MPDPVKPSEESQRYNPAEIEPKWQARWDADPALYAAEDPSSGKPKYYCLEMLPYPSGQLHIGHVRNYAIGDALARFMWMRGANVLHPMGWDAFGLPAENAALKNNVPPREWTLSNIAAMKKQFRRLGMSFDWSREITTCLPEYYRWNQWFFLKMFEAGLAYRKKSKVNWCPVCCTVLANEQVVNGRCWRHEDTLVEQRDLTQWFFRITRYADELLAGLDTLDGWPDKVRTMQRNWIGRSEGAEITFPVYGCTDAMTVTVFTTRVDTIFGATSLQLAPEHPLIQHWTSFDAELAPAVEQMIAQQTAAREAGDLGAIEKHGIPTGRSATNPFTGEQIPIWVANYILADYGTGAIMSVPAHDERDFDFATKYNLPIRRVVAPNLDTDDLPLPYLGEDEGVLIDSGEWSGEACLEAQGKMAAFAQAQGFGKATVTYRLKDWGVSRQRYWGTPIPMVYCDCSPNEPIPVRKSDLPILLPEQIHITQEGGSPLGRVPDFVDTTCPRCGQPAKRETDTMDTFVDSSWYFYRYTDAHNASAPFSSDRANYWFPIDQYIGGVEHAILHLIYSRFWTRVMRDITGPDGQALIANSEPAARLFTQGMVIKDGAKMSKSRGNVVSPDLMIDRYGADATRMYALFAAPPDRDLDWQEDGVAGISRFLARIYRLCTRFATLAQAAGHPPIPEDKSARSSEDLRLLRALHQTIGKITQDFSGRWHFNTSISSIMILVNEIVASEEAMDTGRISPPVIVKTLQCLTQMIAPFAPFLAAELWQELGGAGVVFRTPWPVASEFWAREDEIEIPVQVNGKLVTVLRIAAGTDEPALKAAALADEKVAARIAGKTLLKTIVVPGKLVNLVVK